jgi:hypothetical protein
MLLRLEFQEKIKTSSSLVPLWMSSSASSSASASACRVHTPRGRARPASPARTRLPRGQGLAAARRHACPIVSRSCHCQTGLRGPCRQARANCLPREKTWLRIFGMNPHHIPLFSSACQTIPVCKLSEPNHIFDSFDFHYSFPIYLRFLPRTTHFTTYYYYYVIIIIISRRE